MSALASLPKDAKEAKPVAAASPARLGSIDAYRGLVMFLMMAEVLRLGAVAAFFKDDIVNPQFTQGDFWRFLAWHQTHVPWAGCTLHDLIQPGFSFLVGVSLPFSIAARRAKGQSGWRMALHASWRAIALVLLGVFLRSMSKETTNWTFEDTLSQIGLGYVPLFLLGMTRKRWQWAALVAILVGYWLVFVAHPLPPRDFEYEKVGIPKDWKYHYHGLAAHWNKNSNAAWAFDTWLLNELPRPTKPGPEGPVPQLFTHNAGGYATLSFIPTLATMILGLIAGNWIKGPGTSWHKFGWLILAGGVCLTIGLIAHESGLCPCVKRIWTPSWVLYSGGWCFFFLAAFYGLIDGAGYAAWSFPLRVIGANSIAAYIIAHGWEHFIIRSFHIHLDRFFASGNCFIWWPGGQPYEPLHAGLATLAILWLFLYWLYRQRIFLRI